MPSPNSPQNEIPIPTVENSTHETGLRVKAGKRGAAGPSHSGKTLLVVEDEAPLRRLLVHVLRKNGYTVLEAEKPAAAREIWAAKGAEIDLLITDIVMEGNESGWDLAMDCLAERASLKLLFISGYFRELPEGLALTDDNFLRKPFFPNDLLAQTRLVLERQP